jgi:hypothetical protein
MAITFEASTNLRTITVASFVMTISLSTNSKCSAGCPADEKNNVRGLISMEH